MKPPDEKQIQLELQATETFKRIVNLYSLGSEFYDAALKAEESFIQKFPDVKFGTSCATESWLAKFITVDSDMIQLKNDIRKCSAVNDCVLIQGETGTGKELIARALHSNRKGDFVAINVTNLPSELLESELFGHVRGAFTGAVNDKPGLFRAAANGTLFLDEIGDMPFDLQAKLLRVIQDRKARQLGCNEEYPITARIICATHQDVEFNGKFREDLYHRISVLKLQTKPLRERLGDIKLIVKELTKDWSEDFPADFIWYKPDEVKIELVGEKGYKEIKGINKLQGNVRSIQKVIRRWQVLGRLD